MFTSVGNLKDLICRNKSKLLSTSFHVFTNKTAFSVLYILEKLKRKSSLGPQNTSRTVSIKSGKAQAQKTKN